VAGLTLLAVRWLIAGLFLRSGLAKVTGLPEFRSAVANYRILPPGLVKPVARALPFAEIVAALLLGVGVLPVAVSAALALLLAAFAAAVGVNLARGRVFDCGCGGSVAPRLISWRHVWVDLVLAAAAAVVAAAPPDAVNLWRGPAGLVEEPAPGGGAFPVLLAVVLCYTAAALLRRGLAVRSLAGAAGRSVR
jgi:methylamine utilization protein MauE